MFFFLNSNILFLIIKINKQFISQKRNFKITLEKVSSLKVKKRNLND